MEKQDYLQTRRVMFTRIGPNAVQNSDGYRVEIVKRFELHYQDDFGNAVVPIEPMVDGELVVSASTIDKERREIVTRRISEALDFLGVQHRFD